MTITKFETKEVEVELDLPCYRKDGNSIYSINADESITVANVFDTYCSVSHQSKDNMGYTIKLSDALSYSPATHAEFLSALETFRMKLETATTK